MIQKFVANISILLTALRQVSMNQECVANISTLSQLSSTQVGVHDWRVSSLRVSHSSSSQMCVYNWGISSVPLSPTSPHSALIRWVCLQECIFLHQASFSLLIFLFISLSLSFPHPPNSFSSSLISCLILRFSLSIYDSMSPSSFSLLISPLCGLSLSPSLSLFLSLSPSPFCCVRLPVWGYIHPTVTEHWTQSNFNHHCKTDEQQSL